MLGAARRPEHSRPHAHWSRTYALGLHLLEAAVDNVLFQLEVGNAVAQQAADAVIFLIDGDRVSGAAQLLRCR